MSYFQIGFVFYLAFGFWVWTQLSYEPVIWFLIREVIREEDFSFSEEFFETFLCIAFMFIWPILIIDLI